MSCWIVEPKSVKKIAEVINQTLSHEGMFGIYAPSNGPLAAEYIGMSVEEIYNKLYQMNIDAYDARYGEKDFIPKMPKQGYLGDAYLNIYQTLKTVECFLYQCCEGDVDTRESYKGVEQLANIIRRAIIGKSKEYQNAKWE